jgi:hypothetical protein
VTQRQAAAPGSELRTRAVLAPGMTLLVASVPIGDDALRKTRPKIFRHILRSWLA